MPAGAGCEWHASRGRRHLVAASGKGATTHASQTPGMAPALCPVRAFHTSFQKTRGHSSGRDRNNAPVDAGDSTALAR